ncbi:hypothetical protein [Sphingobium sp. SCG-1]|uniref:hypothetical protein n=1 Tax=Sphingobium sp. SCG-1 TaxID=2072936 RepID=UPI001CB892B0|nr:hypothetical protein [Sphingobium sp. SCG-1]
MAGDLRRTLATGFQRLGVRFEVTEAVLITFAVLALAWRASINVTIGNLKSATTWLCGISPLQRCRSGPEIVLQLAALPQQLVLVARREGDVRIFPGAAPRAG